MGFDAWETLQETIRQVLMEEDPAERGGLGGLEEYEEEAVSIREYLEEHGWGGVEDGAEADVLLPPRLLKRLFSLDTDGALELADRIMEAVEELEDGVGSENADDGGSVAGG